MIPREILKTIRQIELRRNGIVVLCLVLVLSGALAAMLTSCEADQFPGLWEVDVDATIAQYDKVPVGYERNTLLEFQNSLHDELAGRAYIFTRKHPQKPEWGDTEFQGSVEIRQEGKMEFFGAWRMSTNQPSTYELFRYTVNSGASYWPAGNIRTGTNESRALWYQDSEDKPLVLRKK